ncbi:MAG TPA: L-rhamnose mutarotase, partial [Cyclobacteriaceae bacterium]|nr:L-rhamnose mutarotase [Cyclobacteriaceae bacterium]
MQRHCYALDLKDDPQLIAAYEAAHQNVWPEILSSLKEAG